MAHPLVVHCKRDYYDVYCARPSKWGNPFVIGRDGDKQEVIAKFKEYWDSRPDLQAAAKRELKGLILSCYCAPLDCHVDLIATTANEP